LAFLAEEPGVFSYAGAVTARLSRGRPRRLLPAVFAAAALTTAVSGLDATVVLLTPVVFATAARIRARARPHVYACTHLANSASLLPVSNLTNLLNNLPATLVLLPAVASSPGLLAVLVGVNVGPNLTYVGSPATVLWRQILHARGTAPATGEFLRLGAVSVPACLVAGVAALWAGLRLSGVS
jgi:arsenical pump membrane protein